MADLKAISAQDIGPCKICGASAPLYLVVDFARNCEELRGYFLPLTGIPVYYGRCVDCGFLFTRFCDDWSAGDFGRHIYNDDYIKVDPDHHISRPARIAPLIPQLFPNALPTLSLLDWGGGSGAMIKALKDAGIGQVSAYDPFIPAIAARPAGRFNVITCFEVIEHVPDPKAFLADMLNFLDERDGMLIFSTSPQPDQAYIKSLQWFYLAPRNGHISLFTDSAMKRLCDSVGLEVRKIFNDVFMCYRQPPAFAADLLRHFDGNRIN